MSKLRIQRSGYIRKGGVRVKPTSFLQTDRGRPGRGPKILPPIKHKGALGGPGFFKKPLLTQKILVGKAADKYGEQSVQGMSSRHTLEWYNDKSIPIYFNWIEEIGGQNGNRL